LSVYRILVDIDPFLDGPQYLRERRKPAYPNQRLSVSGKAQQVLKRDSPVLSAPIVQQSALSGEGEGRHNMCEIGTLDRIYKATLGVLRIPASLGSEVLKKQNVKAEPLKSQNKLEGSYGVAPITGQIRQSAINKELRHILSPSRLNALSNSIFFRVLLPSGGGTQLHCHAAIAAFRAAEFVAGRLTIRILADAPHSD
jgi:hypothetical protein